MKTILSLVSAGILLAQGASTRATENGGTEYGPGTYGDFGAALFGPAGFYLRADLSLIDAQDRTWVSSLKLAWRTDARLLGARYGLGIAGPHHVTASTGLFVPTGTIDPDHSVGRNYWALDSTASYTWLDGGAEISATAGYLVNTRNRATTYRSETSCTSTSWSPSTSVRGSRARPRATAISRPPTTMDPWPAGSADRLSGSARPRSSRRPWPARTSMSSPNGYATFTP